MKEIKKSIIICRMSVICYIAAIIPLCISVGVLLQSILNWRGQIFEEDRLIRLRPVILSSILLTLITLLFRALVKKISSHYQLKSPYKININLYNEGTILFLLGKKMSLNSVAYNCWFGKERLKRDLRVFVFSLQKDKDYVDVSALERYVGRIDDTSDYTTFSKLYNNLARVRLFVYDEIPQRVLNYAACCVEENIDYNKFIVNLYIGLNEGVLYVPFCCSRTLIGCRLYKHAINRVADWLNIKDDNVRIYR